MKIALVHDYLGEFGGAERVLLALSELYPDAPIYTAFWRPGVAYEQFKHKDIRVSWVHHIPGFATRLHSPLRFLAPFIWNSFDLSGYDVVISSASWYITKGFGTRGTNRTRPVEICYCHTPPRWLYGYPTSVEWQRYAFVRLYARVVGFFMRRYDYQASQRVNYFIANSKNTAGRIVKLYHRNATIIYPPVDLPHAPNVKREEYYLIISRIVGGKGLKLAVEAAKKFGLRLKIAGAPAGYATEYKTLLKDASDRIEFLGFVSDAELVRLYAGAKAFLALATDEDFGITPVEAMSVGTPVIAFRGGGYLESVIEGKTGVFVDRATVEGVGEAIKRFEALHISAKDCRIQAETFSKKRFFEQLRTYIRTHGKGN